MRLVWSWPAVLKNVRSSLSIQEIRPSQDLVNISVFHLTRVTVFWLGARIWGLGGLCFSVVLDRDWRCDLEKSLLWTLAFLSVDLGQAECWTRGPPGHLPPHPSAVWDFCRDRSAWITLKRVDSSLVNLWWATQQIINANKDYWCKKKVFVCGACSRLPEYEQNVLLSIGFRLGWDGDTVGSQAGSGHTPAFTLVQHRGGPVFFFTFRVLSYLCVCWGRCFSSLFWELLILASR